MKLAIISFSDNKDHQEIIYSLYREIKNEIDCVTFGIKNPKYTIDFDENNYFFDCPTRPNINKETFRIKEYKKILKKLKELEIDTIYFESLHVWNLPIMYFLTKIKKIHVIHDIIPHTGTRFYHALKIFNKIITKKSDLVIIHNNKYKDYLTRTYKFSADKVRVVDIYKDFIPESPIQDNRIVSIVGRINMYKGVEYLYDIFKSIPDVDLKLYGKVDVQVLEHIEKLNKLENVEIINRYISNEEYEAAVKESTLVILPYKSATQSGVVIDAYNYSRYVIAFEVGALGEQILDGYSGALVKRGDTTTFSKKINDYFSLPYEERKKLCSQAYHYGFEKYSIQNNYKKWIEIVLN